MSRTTAEPEPPLNTHGHSQNQERLNAHLEYIETQCSRAIQRLSRPMRPVSDIQLENDALELFNRVIDLIRKDNFAFLQRFDGRAKLTTYLTAMVSRQAVELVRRKRGRSRARERAEAQGRLGLQLFQKIFTQGLPLQEAIRELSEEPGQTLPEDRIHRLARHIMGREGLPTPVVIRMGETTAETVFSSDSPERTALNEERTARIRNIVQDIDSRLSGTERFLLRLRFPQTEERGPRPAAEIAAILGISRKAVYRRLDRLLDKCRRIVLDHGLGAEELLSPEAGNSLPASDPKKGHHHHE